MYFDLKFLAEIIVSYSRIENDLQFVILFIDFQEDILDAVKARLLNKLEVYILLTHFALEEVH